MKTKTKKPCNAAKSFPIESIKREYEDGARPVDLAAKHKCSLGTIYAILNGKHWSQRDGLEKY